MSAPRRARGPRQKQKEKKRVAPGATVEIPDKPFFKIGELAKLADVEPYVLRYWESEFRTWIRPEKTRTGQRMYRRADVDVVLTIRRLLRDEGYRIDGARRKLRELHGEELELPGAARAQLRLIADKVRAELDAIEALAAELERP